MEKHDWLDVLHDVCPTGKADLLDGMATALPMLCRELHLDTIDLQAMALGQWATETGGFRSIEENLSYSAKRLTQVWPKRFPTLASAQPYARNPKALANKVYGGRLGNRPGTDDGWIYRGSGIDQTTGRYNFEKAGYLDNPDELRTVKGAIAAAAVYWSNHDCTAAAKRGIEALTKVINGGLNGLADRKAYTSKFRKALAEHHDVDLVEDEEDEVAETPTMLIQAPVEVVTAVTSRTLPRPSKGEVLALQKRLKEVGYDPGKLDGLWGGNTQAALSAYQHDRELPMTGQLDAATKTALPEPWVRPVAPERAEATAAQLAAEGSRTVKATQEGKATTLVGGGAVGLGGLFTFVKDGFADAHDQVSEWAQYLPHLHPGFLVGGALGILGFAYWKLHQAEKAKVDDHRQGRIA